MKITTLAISILVLIPNILLASDETPKDFDLSTKKVIVKYNGDKLEPSKVSLNRLDSSVFFLNSSDGKLVNIEVDFKEKKIHCHSDNFKLADGILKTTRPIKPRDFEVLCFPSLGTYSYRVKEEGGKVSKGEVEIHE